MKKSNPAALWPKWFLTSLNKKERKKIKAAVLKKLILGQAYLWESLNLYDDIMDEPSDAKKLPQANNYFRRYLEIYYRLDLSNDFYDIFNLLFDDLDRANFQEATRKKLKVRSGLIVPYERMPEFPDLKSLSKKSLALCAGPLAILYLIGDGSSLKKAPGLINFFRYALSAKQLADDSCDWLEDLKNGAITYPNSLVIKAARNKRLKLDLKKNPEIAYLLFVEIAPLISRDIYSLCRKARHEAKEIGLPVKSPLILNLIKPLEKAVLKAQKFNRLLKTG